MAASPVVMAEESSGTLTENKELEDGEIDDLEEGEIDDDDPTTTEYNFNSCEQNSSETNVYNRQRSYIKAKAQPQERELTNADIPSRNEGKRPNSSRRNTGRRPRSDERTRDEPVTWERGRFTNANSEPRRPFWGHIWPESSRDINHTTSHSHRAQPNVEHFRRPHNESCILC